MSISISGNLSLCLHANKIRTIYFSLINKSNSPAVAIYDPTEQLVGASMEQASHPQGINYSKPRNPLTRQGRRPILSTGGLLPD